MKNALNTNKFLALAFATAFIGNAAQANFTETATKFFGSCYETAKNHQVKVGVGAVAATYYLYNAYKNSDKKWWEKDTYRKPQPNDVKDQYYTYDPRRLNVVNFFKALGSIFYSNYTKGGIGFLAKSWEYITAKKKLSTVEADLKEQQNLFNNIVKLSGKTAKNYEDASAAYDKVVKAINDCADLNALNDLIKNKFNKDSNILSNLDSVNNLEIAPAKEALIKLVTEANVISLAESLKPADAV